jgi:hypothetical protein
MNDLIDAIGPVAFAGFAIALTVVLLWWRYHRAATMIDEWASHEGLEVVSKSVCWFWPGPFWFRTSRNQVVYRVRVRDQEGQEYSGYIRLGNWFLGLWIDEVAVEWDR